MELTTREVAVLFWLAVGAGLALRQPDIRSLFVQVLRTAAHPHILGFVAAVMAYTILQVLLLAHVGVWSTAYLKETVLWFSLTGLVFGGRALTGYDTPPYREAVMDGLRVLVAIEFVLGLVPFSLPIELVLVPSILGLVLLIEVGKLQEDPASQRTVKFLSGVQSVIGLVILVLAFRRVIAEASALAEPSILMGFFIPPLLSLLFLPAMFVIVLFARYEWLLSKLQGDRRYLWYARRQLFRRLGFRPSAILEFGRQHGLALVGIRSRAELDELLKSGR